ncbi:hypothetical protein [Ferranicluibacter rubi]|uniref:hypothetical protein n=1 Tax=Ferranicluibacter rubi TaxID=2715133 RepID=UPI00248BDC95|nr:hypothetical protein [Ferranicluibacter rubi]
MVTPSRKTSSAGSLRDELATERAKLSGIAAQATKNATDAQLRDRSTHTGTQPADTITDGTTNKAYTATERAKLAGIATGATANDTDANLKNRANHTGTQPADTIVDGTVNKVYTATEKTKLGALPDNATLQTSIGNRIAATEKGAINGVATLGGDGKVPAIQLPSYVDDVLEYANFAAFPATGESGKIYVAQDTNKTYRWSGSAYPEISASPGSTDAVTEGASNLYFTAQRVRDTLLAGVSFATNAVIAASDSFIVMAGKLQAQISNRLQFDAVQTLTTGQKTQGQTNLGVDPTTLDARYNRLSQVIADSQLPARLKAGLAGIVADCNLFRETGWAFATNTALNLPNANTHAWLRYQGDGGNGYQWAKEVFTERSYRRRWFGDTWGAWERVYEGETELDARYKTNLEVQGFVGARQGAPGVNGYASLVAGGPDNTGFLEFNQKNGSRTGYIGYANAAFKRMGFTAENGYEWEFTGSVYHNQRPYYNGQPLATLAEATAGDGGIAGVSSWGGRTGTVTPQSGDYTSAQISHSGSTLADALAALNGNKQQALSQLQNIELGVGLSGDRDSFIDFHSYGAPNAADFAARIDREPGVNGNFTFAQTGTGSISFLGGNGMFYNGVAIATVNYVTSAINAVIAAAPGALDTLDELAAALGDDPNFRTTILNAIAAKEAAFDTLDGGTV